MDIVHDFIERALRAISELSFAGLVSAALGAFGGCMALFAALCLYFVFTGRALALGGYIVAILAAISPSVIFTLERP